MSDSEKLVFEVDMCDLTRENLGEKLGYIMKDNKFFDSRGYDVTENMLSSYPDEAIKKVLGECIRSILGEGGNK